MTATTGAAVEAPQLISISASGTWRGLLRTDLTASARQFATSEPASFGGDDSAPTPMDYVVGAFLGCITVIIELVARERGIHLDAIESEASGVIDIRGVSGVPGVSPTFQTFTGSLRLDAELAPEELAEFVAEVERRCPAYNLFLDAGGEAAGHVVSQRDESRTAVGPGTYVRRRWGGLRSHPAVSATGAWAGTRRSSREVVAALACRAAETP